MRKKRSQSVKLESSQSDTDRPRNNSSKGCHQTDTLLGKMKITQKKGAELFHPKLGLGLGLGLNYVWADGGRFSFSLIFW